METYQLRLFVSGRGARAERAVENLRAICEEALDGGCSLEIVDVLEDPQRAEEAKILATPTLVKDAPPPIRRFIGDLSERASVLAGLSL